MRLLMCDPSAVTPKLCIAQNPEADALLERDPLALLVGMLLDQQIAMEVAFNGPYKIYTRMGNKFDIHEIANHDPEEFATMAATPPAIHRYGRSMAKRVQTLCQYIIEHYDGDAAAIWTRDKPTGAEVLKRLKALPGYGEQKAKIFLALLGKQYGATPYGWRKAAGEYGPPNTRKSVADVTDPETLAKVRAYKKAAKIAVEENSSR